MRWPVRRTGSCQSLRCCPTLEQVRSILRLCHRLRVPVVARGAGTGLSGGALPHRQGVLLSLAKFSAILDIDPEQRLARVQPGVRNLAISQAAESFGLYYAPDPSSQIACSIGGNVAENSGGARLFGNRSAARVGNISSRYVRIFLMTTGSSMQAITLAAPPQARQVFTSIRRPEATLMWKSAEPAEEQRRSLPASKIRRLSRRY